MTESLQPVHEPTAAETGTEVEIFERLVTEAIDGCGPSFRPDYVANAIRLNYVLISRERSRLVGEL